MKRFIVAVVVLVALAAPAAASADGGGGGGAVYTLTNSASGNQLVVYARSASGKLTWAATRATGGRGTGANLGSQGALALSGDHRWLYAVNAASNTISVFAVDGTQTKLAKVIDSGGAEPISITEHDGRVYVLNDATPNVVGFRVNSTGLSAISGGSQPLAAADSGPAQVGFSPDGQHLVVTDKSSNTIDTFAVASDGSLGPAHSQPSDGGTPFGFAFTPSGTLIVSDANQAPSSAATAYSLASSGQLTSLSGAIQTNQAAACWVAVTPDGHFAYTANAGSGTVSGFRVGPGGSLNLLDGNGVTANIGVGTHPLDEAVSPDGSFFYILADGTHQLKGYRIGSGGQLRAVSTVGGLPAGDVSVAVS